MTGKWLYDIVLPRDGKYILVGDQGDEEFDTKEEARADADDYIISMLEKEYNAKAREFEVNCYQAQY